MFLRLGVTTAYRELRVHLCQTSQSFVGARSFASESYDDMKTSNPDLSGLTQEPKLETRESRYSKDFNGVLDDSLNSVILFPGQGSEYVGMGVELAQKLPSVKQMFDRASHILGYDLLHLCEHGPQEELHKTIHSQPAVVVASLAAVEKLYDQNPSAVTNCVATAGFSVGEITSLIFSGAFTFDTGMHLVKSRAEAMQDCCNIVDSGMMSVFFGAKHKLGFATEAAKEWAQKRFDIEDPVCHVANFLYAGAKVVAGHNPCLNFIEENMNDFGLRRCKRLPVSGAFHTSLMNGARLKLTSDLKNMEVHEPRIPGKNIIYMYSNCDLRILKSANYIRKTLPMQITRTVKWEQSMNAIFEYKSPEFMPHLYECGPGKGTLIAMLRRIKGTATKKSTYILPN